MGLIILVSILCVVIAVLFIFKTITKNFNGPLTQLAHDMTGQTVIITGGDSSIGFIVAKELMQRGAKVVLACRNEKHANTKLASIKDKTVSQRGIYLYLDLTDLDSVVKFVNNVKSNIGKIDILINNAGTCFQQFQLIKGIEKTLFTNHIGHVLLTSLLLDNNCFNKKSRVIHVSTTKYKRISEKELTNFTATNNCDFSITQHNYDWMKVYVMSKLGNILHMLYLKDYIVKNGLEMKTVAIHPGYVRNEFFKGIHSLYWTIRQTVMIPFRWCLFKDEQMGAQTHLHTSYMKYEELENGGYYRDCHIEELKPIATNFGNVQKMMDFTKTLLVKNGICGEHKGILKYFK